MGFGKKLWDLSGWIVAAYTVYSHFQTLNKAKDEFYTNLGPAEQARWDMIFGKPAVVAAKPVAPTAVQVASGT